MHVCSIYKIKGMSHFYIAHTHATISVALKALSLSFSLSGCSDLSPNPTNIPALPERGTTMLMHSNLDEAQHFCVYSCFLSVYCCYWYLWNYCIIIHEIGALSQYCILQKCSLTSQQSHTKVQLYRYNHGISNINRHDQDQHNEEPSIPCASARQKMHPVKKIKKQIKCLSHTTVTLLEPGE